jgi:hypothetical protein
MERRVNKGSAMIPRRKAGPRLQRDRTILPIFDAEFVLHAARPDRTAISPFEKPVALDFAHLFFALRT